MAKKQNEITVGKNVDSAMQPAGKMSIYDYEQKYTKRQNVRGAKFLLRAFAAIVGVFLFVMLTLVTLKVYEYNSYAGYATGAACIIAFIFVFIVPLCKIFKTGYFVTNVNAFTAREAQKHNKKLRREISEKMIDFSGKVEGVGWYDGEIIKKLSAALKNGDESNVKECLSELYKGSVKKSAKDLIFKSAMRSAAYSAVSQSAKIDAALIVVVNVQLVKDLVFLYGFRPSDAGLVKILGSVLTNALTAYGLGGLNIGNGVARTMGDVVRDIPILGTAIAAIVDSSVQGLANGALTAVIGYQTIKYLNREYRLQDILDGVDVSETPVELEETCNELERQLKKKKKFGAAAV